MPKIHLVRISSDIVEDHYQEGEIQSTGCGLNKQPIGVTFDSLNDAFKYLSDHYGLSKTADEYEIKSDCFLTSKMVADHSGVQNGGWFDPTPEEYKLWKKGRMKLYTEQSTITYLKVAD